MECKLSTPEDCIERMVYDLEHGKEKGTTTYIDEIDPFWTWRRGELNVTSGYNNEGKGTMLRFLSLIKVLEEKDWKVALNSPEDSSPHEYFDNLIHTLSGLTTDKDNKYNTIISKEEYLKYYELIKGKFFFSYIKPPDNTIENAIEEFKKLHKKYGISEFIFDPMLKFQKSKNAPERVEDYSAYVVTLLGDFARETNSSVHLVIHQLTPKKLETGLYPTVSAYQIRGGGLIADGTDNALFVQRPLYARDKKSTLTVFGSEKIKHHKLVGIPDQIELEFNRKTNRYTYKDGGDIYNWDKWSINRKKTIKTF
jgi:hypothetical protein